MDKYVPIIEISEENISSMWPALENAIANSSFIALDCELSGLGNRSKLNCSEIDQRYLNTKDIAQEYSIISFGISCFTCQSCSPFELDNGSKESVKSHDYLIQTFNVLTLCASKYSVECNSLKFLLSHGFDFNKLYSHGLPYTRGEDEELEKMEVKEDLSVKKIFRLVLEHRKPIVIHNGFLDLVFLYQSFYADLPKNIETFAADLQDMFPSGIYDTKYISEYYQSFPATFLEYVFKKVQLENSKRNENGNWHCRIKFPPYPRSGIQGLKWHYYLEVFDEISYSSEEPQEPLCESYKFHGWCSKGNSCSESHNINRIVRELPNSSSSKARERRISKGVAMSSLAQLINMKKRNLEEDRNREKKVKIRKRRIKSSKECKTKNNNEESNNHVGDQNKSPVADSDPISKVAELSVHSNSNSESCESCESVENHSPHNVVDSSAPSPVGFSFSGDDDSSISPQNQRKNRKCQGHSAGYDAFMTGFIFACNVAVIGRVPSVAAFESSRELNLHHTVNKVYLIGKGFPFLIRNSSYGGTSATHERLIKLIRNS